MRWYHAWNMNCELILMAWKYVSCEVLSLLLKGLLPYYDKGTRLYCFLDQIFKRNFTTKMCVWVPCIYSTIIHKKKKLLIKILTIKNFDLKEALYVFW